MDSWSEISRIPVTSWSNGGPLVDAPNVTSLHFDNSQNLIWCGDANGCTRSFTSSTSSGSLNPYQTNLQLFPYTKFTTAPKRTPVIQHLSHRDGILSLSKNHLNFSHRRGIPKLDISADSFTENGDLFSNLNTMTYNCNSLNDVVLGANLSLLKLDLNKSNILSSFNHDGGISLINNSSKLLTLGRNNGSLELFDPISNSSVKTFNSHNGFISDMDVRGHYIATCGYSVRPKRYHHHQHQMGAQTNDYMVDPLVNIYDTRIMRAIAPVPFPAGATSVRFHPKLPNIVIISSNTGQIQFVDIFDQTNVYLYQADLSPTGPNQGNKPPQLSNLEISDNGDFLLFNDSYSNMHLWSITNTGTSSKDFVNFPKPIDQPDVIETPIVDKIGVDDIVPLSCIGMPYYKDLLLSNYASDLKFTKELARVPEKIDIDLIIECEKNPGRFIRYDKAKYGPRNIVKKFESLNDKNSQLPKFISERKNGNDEENQDAESQVVDESIFQFKNTSPARVPNCYSRLQIQYSRFGVRDFDFNYYNKTEGLYCGLENHTDNSYINSLLQLYRFQPLFFNKIANNLLNEWLPNDIETILTRKNPEGSSILTELGYLFDMMHKAKDNNVKIYNFSQVMNHNQEANIQNLINCNDMKNLNSQEVRNLIISFNNFLLNQINQDLHIQSNDSLGKFMQINYEIEIRGNAHSCPIFDKKYGSMFSLDLVTPPSNMLTKMSILINPALNTQPPPPPTMANIRKNLNILTYLEYSMNQFKTIPCQQHQHAYPHNLEIKTLISNLPPLLVLNVNLSNQEFKFINGFKKWLVPEFYAINQMVQTNGIAVNKISLKPMISQFDKFSLKYDLLGYVCEISDKSDLERGVHGLVTYVKMNDQWYLFNDFLVMPIPEEEVFNLTYPWKKPVIIMYQESSVTEVPFEYFQRDTFNNLPNLNSNILYRDHFAGAIREGYKKEYELLTREEAPSHGTLVAIDAEFVSLKPEELEVRYDGSKKLITPKQLSLARISVLRGDNGPKQGKAFIDDYIVHTADIYDYLTNFSGIEENDLDPTKSSKNLVTLQTTYRKLWLLVNLGVVFVGHGLYNDFRCINLQVPSDQIRDTAEYFYKSDFKRKLSLKFLAYVMLKEKVQTNNHDSIEDAYTALLLYKKYLEVTAVGEFENTLNYIYSEGQQLRFRVPE
ncbi:PAN2 [[Candida] subhashii]|uniref:PAN2-PAN3 deadenylation complex catalytic subunit PAN2 n=1 Tax=[Candida] subhashii TaxID=561895 RepID=A0A8J5QJI6_9ASCO|nr:PAN2 [[Candida] subhashii]KAG7661987.1 PAN2 [[Candida] subhashii]